MAELTTTDRIAGALARTAADLQRANGGSRRRPGDLA